MIARAIQGIRNNSFFNNILEKNRSKIFIYPNLHGLGVGLFVFFCFLIAVFYENNFALLLSIILFFIFFISIFISHQNINHLSISWIDEYFVEAKHNEKIQIKVLNQSKEKKLNLDIEYNKKNIGNFNFFKNINFININYLNDQRGTYSLNRIIFKSIYPFGFMRTKRYFDSKSKIIVYPKSLKPNQEILNDFNLFMQGYSNHEFEGIEDYKNGESHSKIAWKKSTIKNKKYIKKFEEPKKENKIILDLDQYPEIPFETLLGYSTYIIKHYFKIKEDLTIKHRGETFYLNQNENSLKLILKYLANVQSKI